MQYSDHFNVVEYFTSFQGEALSVGKNMFFLRLSGCNLECSFCDTKYSWKKINKQMSITDVYQAYQNSGSFGICITGGCPLLQSEAICSLLDSFNFEHVEIETNGTFCPNILNRVINKVTNFNVSPKLSNSGNDLSRSVNYFVLQKFNELDNSIFKFVVGSKSDFEEVKDLQKKLSLKKEKIYIMPKGFSDKEVLKNLKDLSSLVLREGFSISPRLHLMVGFE